MTDATGSITILSGPAGAGKSTVARTVAAISRWEHRPCGFASTAAHRVRERGATADGIDGFGPCPSLSSHFSRRRVTKR